VEKENLMTLLNNESSIYKEKVEQMKKLQIILKMA